MTIQEAAKYLKLSTKTLRRWEASGKLIPVRTSGGHRRYSTEHIRVILSSKSKRVNQVASAIPTISNHQQVIETVPDSPKVVEHKPEIDTVFQPQFSAHDTVIPEVTEPFFGTPIIQPELVSTSFEMIEPTTFAEPIVKSSFSFPTRLAFSYFGIFIIVSVLIFSLIKGAPHVVRVAHSLFNSDTTSNELASSSEQSDGSSVLAASVTQTIPTFRVNVESNFSQDVTIENNLAVNGGTISTTATDFSLLTSTTNLSIASQTGTTTINGSARIGDGTAGNVNFTGGDLFVTGDIETNGIAFIPTLSLGGDTFTDLTGTGLVVANGVLSSTLGTTIDSSDIVDSSINEVDLNSSNDASNGNILSYNSSTGGFTWTSFPSVDTGPWQTDSNVANLAESTDNVTIGSATELAKLGIDGDTDEIQLLVQANATQTSPFFVLEDSSGTDLFRITATGTIDNVTSIYTDDEVGIATSNADRALEINSATGGNLRLTYNDSNGSASTYADFLVSSGGDLSIVPTGGDIILGQDGTSGRLTLYNELGGTDRTTLFQNSGSQSQDVTYTLPVDDGTSNYVLTTDGSGVLSWQSVGGVGAFTSFTAAGDSGGGRIISNADTLSILGGTNGIDTVDSATDTVTLNLDTTEIGSTTFGSGSGITWTFDASAGTDTTIAFDNDTQTFTAGTALFTGDLDLADDNWIGLSSSAGLIEFDDQTTDEVNILNANVGIGTSTPGATLDVNGNVWTNNGANRFSSSGLIRIGGADHYLAPNGTTLELGSVTSGALAFEVDAGNVRAATITSTGTFGIGDTTADAKLEVLATTEQLRLTHTDGTVDARFTVDSSGHLTIDGSTDGTGSQTLTLTGYSTLTASTLATFTTASTLTLSGDAVLAGGDLTLGSTSVDGTLTLYNNTANFYSRFTTSNSQGADITYTLPIDDGGSNYVLTSDGSGVLSWQAIGGGGGLGGDITAVGNITSGDAFTSGTPGGSLYFATGGDILDANGNELIQLTTTASAVNELTLANAAASGNVTWTLTGGDTDISLATVLKAEGSALFSSTTSNTDTIAIKPQTSTATNSFTGTITSADLTAARTYTLPDDTGTVCLSSGNCAGGAGGSKWTDSGSVTYLTSTTDDLAVGGSTLAASMFGIDEDAGNFYFGYDNSASPTFNFEASDGDAGVFGFNTSDAFYFSGANVGIGQTAPTYPLTIAGGGTGNGGAHIRLEDSSGKVWSLRSGIAGVTNNSLEFRNETDSLNLLTITSAGNIGIGAETSPDYTLELFDATNSPVFALSDDDVVHGLTTLAETDIYAHLTSLSTTAGGAQLTTISDTDAQAFSLRGVIGSTDPTDTTPAIKIIGAKSNGTTGIADLGAAETVFQVANNDDTAALTIQGNGEIGIGTVSPGAKLEIQGAGGSDAALLVKGGTSQVADFIQVVDSGGTLEYFSIDPSNGAIFNEVGSSAVDFRIEGDTTANLFFADASADLIGIGTNAPGAKLDIINTANDDALTITANGTQSNPILRIFESDGSTENVRFYPAVSDGASALAYTFNTVNALSNASAQLASFRNDGTAQIIFQALGGAVFNEAGNDSDFRVEGDTNANLLFIDASTDYIGIGTNAPIRPLHLYKSDTTAYSAGIANTSEFVIQNPDTTNTNFTSLAFASLDSGSNYFAGSRIASVATNHTDGAETAALTFSTYASGTFNERMRIHTDGSVGIGDATPDAFVDIDSSATTGNIFGIASTTLTTGNIIDLTSTYVDATGGSDSAIDINLTNDPSVSANTLLGLDLAVTDSDDNANTVYGVVSNVNNSSNTATGTHTIYGGHFTATGKTAGTTTAIGLYATASGADSNYAAIFNAGRVGIGTTSPQDKLHVAATGNDSGLVVGRNGSASEDYAPIISFRNDDSGTTIAALQTGLSGTNGANLNFYTKPDGSSISQVGVWTSAGAFGVGDTTPDAKIESLATSEQLRLTYTDNTVDARFSVDSSGHLTIDGSTDGTGSQTLTLTGYSTLTASTLATLTTASTLTASGDLVLAGGDIQLGQNGTDGTLTLYNELGGTDYNVVFQTSASQTQTTTYTLPVDDGTNNYVLTTNGSGVLSWASVSGVGGMNSFIAAGDSGGGQTIADGNTLSILGGTNGVDTVDSATDTVTLNLDTTEIGNATFGSGSGTTWTFDAGATDPTIAFASDQFTFTAATAVFSGDIDLADDNWVGLSSGAANIEFDDQTTDEVNILNANVGIGTSTPSTLLHLVGASSPELRIGLDADNYSRFYKSSGTTNIRDFANTGNSLIDIDPIANDGSGNSQFRFFRNTTTSGTRSISIYLGDGTSTLQHFFNSAGNSYVQANSNNFGIADTGPDAKLEVLATTEQLRLSHTDGTVDARVTVGSGGDLTIDGSSDGTGSQAFTLTGYSTLTASTLATLTTAASLSATSTTTLTLGTNATINANATALNLQADGSPDVNIAGGSGATGCTVANSSGNLTCSGDITATGGDVTGVSGNSIDLGEATSNTMGFTVNSTLELLLNGTNLTAGTAEGNSLGSATAEWEQLFLGDDNGISFGLDQDWTFGYDEATDDRLELVTAGSTGMLISSATVSGTGLLTTFDSVTTGTGLTFSVDGLTSGNGLLLESTTTSSSFSGNLGLIQWAPGSSTTATGDLFRINIGTNGTTSGYLFNVADTGSTLFNVSESQITSALPHQFTAAGDLSLAYDLQFTNQTASYIKSVGPLYLEAGETFESNNVNVTTYNSGILNVAATGGSLFTRSAGTVASFNRTSSDGTILSLQQDGAEEGTISVSGTTVSYNAFTGSHYAWTDSSIDQGKLVSLTGDNRYLHNNPQSEIIYGISQTALKNDSKVLGSYLSVLNPSEAQTNENPHLVMAVGNGQMWVADNGENLTAGDFLISSDLAGHAEKDKGDYATSYIVARVAQNVDWSTISETQDGRKHAKISVFYEFFAKNNTSALANASVNTDPGSFDLASAGLTQGVQGIEANFAKLTVLGQTLLSDTVVNGKLNVGTLIFDNVDQSMNAVGTLKIQDLALGNIEFLGGLISFDTEGNIVAKSVTVEKVKVAGASAGTATLSAGQTSVFVQSSQVTDSSLIFVTAKTVANSPLTVTGKQTGSGFTVSVSTSQGQPVSFDWFIVDKTN